MDLGSYFRILGIEETNPSWNKIKSQYRKKVLETHPDKGGHAKDFRNVYDAYQTIRKVYSDKINGEKTNKFEYQRLSEEVINEIQESIFEKQIIPEINYFIEKEPKLQNYFDVLKKHKGELFRKGAFSNPNVILNSGKELLEGWLFNRGINNGYSSLYYELDNVIFTKPFDRELFEKTVLLTNKQYYDDFMEEYKFHDFVKGFSLNGKNIRGMTLIFDFNAPEKFEGNDKNDSCFSANVFGREIYVDKIIPNLRVLNYGNFFNVEGYKCLNKNPLIDLDLSENKNFYIGFDIETVSKFIEKLGKDLDSKDFEIELTGSVPKNYPFKRNASSNGIYINNFKLGDLEVIVEGASSNLGKYFETKI